MYFKKSKEPKLTEELFKNPTSEYRGAPFWAWNSALDLNELGWQIEVFKKMGFGGFNMHVRQGLETPYLGKGYMDAVRFCAQKAQEENMFAWLYDEDRWPSGVAGGIVTKNPIHRQKYLNMTFTDNPDCAQSKAQASETGKPFFLACFSVEIGDDGKMLSYKKVDRFSDAPNKRYFFLQQRQGGEPRYNYQSYVDLLSKPAVDEFIKVTHQSLKNSVGEYFGKSIPSIFTDEPQLYGTLPCRSGFDKRDVGFSWTSDFDDTYKQEYNSDILDFLPELFYTTDDLHAFETRFNYYTHLSNRFCKAYIDNVAEWCEKNGLPLSGHLLGEDALFETCLDNSDCMRAYKNMQLPGIDILCDDVVFNTPIQCRSVCRQTGKDAMLSEMYGVTGWDFDFRGHKYQGDWQACLGVNVRVPHLAWQTMKGEGKRDYPAPIFYQSPWWEEYKYLEDHYSRINTAMTRGEPDVKIGVIYPIDTYKMIYGSLDESKELRDEIEGNYKQTTEWLLSNGYDFDFVAESLLVDLCKKPGNPLTVGKMSYDAIIVSDCMTLRPYTFKVLKKFKEDGGLLIVMGRQPEFINAVKNDSVKELLTGAKVIPHSISQLLGALEKIERVDIRYTNGQKARSLMCSRRIDGKDKWLFFAHTTKPALPHLSTKEELVFTVKGSYNVTLYDTITGEIRPLSYETDGTTTRFYATLYDLDTLLVKLSPCKAEKHLPIEKEEIYAEIPINSTVSATLREPNVLLLDMARYQVDGGEIQPEEEIMRLDSLVRKQLGLALRKFKVVQPYAIANAPEDHVVKLYFTVYSDIELSGCKLALEHPETTEITLNDEAVDNTPCGYYVDKHIKTVNLGTILKGENVITLTMPFGLRTDLEACYLIGDFATSVQGTNKKLTKKRDELCFGDVTRQGLCFYGGNIDYNVDIELEKDGDIKTTVSHYRGALVGVKLDGKEIGKIAFPPFNLDVKNVKKGKHTLTYTLFGTRYNTFSALHNLNADKKRIYMGPDFWRSENEAWSYEYNFRPMGILKTPVVKIKK